jgi:adenine-specific DNA-methyltransferase
LFSTDADKLRFILEAEAEFIELLLDEDLSAEAKAAERPKYITNYIGSKQKLTDWIWANTTDGAKTAVDAFSGSSVVGYMYKSKGLAVHAIDRLAYCHHIARAIVENDKVTLSDEEIEGLLADSGGVRDFVRKHFGGVYFEPGVHKLIDIVRSNADKLSGYKKDIALFALGKTCITAKGGFGHFGTTKKQDNRADSPAEFKERFAKNCQRINALVFEGEKACKAHHGDTRKLLGKLEADVAYFDPPYATHFSQTNYERAYHFIEGLMTWWENKEIQKDSKTRSYEIPTEVTKANSKGFFEEFLGAAGHIGHWIISYRDQAYPSESEIKKIIAQSGKSSRMKSKTHQYHISAGHGENSLAKEHLFVCMPGGAKADVENDESGMMNAEWEDEEQLSSDGDFLPHCAFGVPHIDDPDLLEALAAPNDADAVRVTAFMGNKYFILDFLWKQTPKDAKSVLDAFSGGANVGYFYKKKGLRVVANDKLHYPHHIARALIENNSTMLDDEDIGSIFADNPKAGSFCEEQFYGYYFTKPILHFLDVAWTNIQTLEGYKKDLALTALGWTVVGKAKFGQFSRSKKGLTGPVSNPEGRQTSLSNIPLSDFQNRFRLNLARVNKLVFDNGQENKATRSEAVEALKKTDCDLVYADPPYITQFGANDYGLNLHFVEGLMTMWAGKELRDNARRDFESGTRYTRESIGDLIADIVAHAGGKHLLLSYRDKAFPDEKTIHGLFKERFKKARVTGIEVEYAMIRNDPARGGKHARELVFIGSEPIRAKADLEFERNIHTRITGDLDPDSLSADAEKTGDKRFTFILTHQGTNRNGDHFTADELQQAAETAVGRKIDLSHSQEFRDIVGGIVEARFVEAGDESRVECVGELFTEESEPARLAYKLMKRGIVSHVSMECDYQEGECSICGKRIKNKADYCLHLKNFKGKDYKGKACFEILHGVTFTGMGLLDREGADERAAIERVAANTESHENERSEAMADKEEKRVGAEPPDPSELSETEKMKLIQKQQTEIERLTKELEALRRQLEESQAEQRRNARKAKAEELLKEWETRGRDFSDDEVRKAEIERLMALSDDAFEATLHAVKSFAAPVRKNEDEEEDEDGGKPGKPAKKTDKTKDKKNSGKTMKGKADRNDSDGEPSHVADNGDSLAKRLSNGFMAAYKDRAGIPAGE